MNAAFEHAKLIADELHGINIPKYFAQQIDHVKIKGVESDTLSILESGPDHVEYWEAWDDVLCNGWCKDESGMVWRFYQEGDLWMIPESVTIGFWEYEGLCHEH